MTHKAILAIDAGGTSFKYALLDYGTLEALGKESFLPVSTLSTKEGFLSVFETILKDASCQVQEKEVELARIALSVPGPFDCSKGISHMAHKWIGLKEVCLTEAFRSFGIVPKTTPISYVHDVHAFLLGEKFFGKAKDIDNVAAVVIGTGVGFGMWRDSSSFLVDETGHPICGIYKYPYGSGNVEDYISGRGLVSAYEKRCGRSLSAKEMADAARGGDERARNCFESMGSILGNVLAPIFSKYDMHALIVGGRISLAYDLYEDSLKKALYKENDSIKVFPSVLLEEAAMKGAALWGKMQD